MCGSEIGMMDYFAIGKLLCVLILKPLIIRDYKMDEQSFIRRNFSEMFSTLLEFDRQIELLEAANIDDDYLKSLINDLIATNRRMFFQLDGSDQESLL